MDPQDGSRGQVEPVADPSDLIVGTIRPPSWLRRIPRLAWLFIALAALDGVYRVWLEASQVSDRVSVTSLVGLMLSAVAGAAIVVLPAAIVIGSPRPRRAGSWLLQGAIALAVAELVGLLGNRVIATIAGPDFAGLGFDVPEFLVRSALVGVSTVVIQIAGLARMGLGLRAIAASTRPVGRILFAAPAAALAVLLFADLLTIQVSEIAPATPGDAISLAYSLLLLVIGAIVLVLWAWIASLAFRQHGRAWRWIAIGAGAIALASVVDAIGWTVVLQRQNPADIPTIPVWFGFAASLARTTGAVSLVLGFGRGFDPVTAEAESASDGAPGAGANIGPLDV
jgi:hypothetical protein